MNTQVTLIMITALAVLSAIRWLMRNTRNPFRSARSLAARGAGVGQIARELRLAEDVVVMMVRHPATAQKGRR